MQETGNPRTLRERAAGRMDLAAERIVRRVVSS